MLTQGGQTAIDSDAILQYFRGLVYQKTETSID